MKNNKLKQKQRAKRNLPALYNQMRQSWMENSKRILGFFGVPVKYAEQVEHEEENGLIKRMTNWQNHQWQKSFKGEPKKRNALENIRKFAVMMRA